MRKILKIAMPLSWLAMTGKWASNDFKYNKHYVDLSSAKVHGRKEQKGIIFDELTLF